eukprot:Protomagalhaensia_sp_Gyna_25__4444@NODE_406_length_3550_cov_9_261464_g312_i0_p4_GENE_NODE_406_length_3550_cov_9_261464_g312_i0NODE_406_length_3550_cov_9_261464_g312_i0_p4_ORF_typecomplete_len172_score34_24_NODE_406_length_3550_cov_9_261464_g312_i014101925
MRQYHTSSLTDCENKLPTVYHDCVTMATKSPEVTKGPQEGKMEGEEEEDNTLGLTVIGQEDAESPGNTLIRDSNEGLSTRTAVKDNRFGWKDSAMEQIATRDKEQRDVWTAVCDSYRNLLLENASLRAQLSRTVSDRPPKRDWTRIDSKHETAQMRAPPWDPETLTQMAVK